MSKWYINRTGQTEPAGVTTACSDGLRSRVFAFRVDDRDPLLGFERRSTQFTEGDVDFLRVEGQSDLLGGRFLIVTVASKHRCPTFRLEV